MTNKYPRGFYIGLSLSWAYPVAALYYNWIIEPGYLVAMGVPYTFFFGCLVHILFIITWVLIRRSKLNKMEVIYLLLSLLIMIILTWLSDRGFLGRFY